MNALSAWQARLELTDRAAAGELGLELKEFARQKATKPSRQTCLLLAIFTVEPGIRAKGTAAAAAAALGRPPAKSEEPVPNDRS